MSQRELGTVIWFDKEKGFGIIECTYDEDFLVHKDQIRDKRRNSLQEGDCVEFTMDKDPSHPPLARDIRVLKKLPN